MKNNKKEEFYNYISNCNKASAIKAELNSVKKDLKLLLITQDALEGAVEHKISVQALETLYNLIDDKYKALQMKKLQLKLQLNAIERNLLDFEYAQFLED